MLFVLFGTKLLHEAVKEMHGKQRTIVIHSGSTKTTAKNILSVNAVQSKASLSQPLIHAAVHEGSTTP